MAQEFTINSEVIESKINSLLPSQGGFGAGVDFSASTMIIPIIDLTATASGASLRQDLQRSVSLINATVIAVNSSTQTVASIPGYYNLKGGVHMTNRSSGSQTFNIVLTDGITSKTIFAFNNPGGGTTNVNIANVDLDIFLATGVSCVVTSGVQALFDGYIRQIATSDGTVVLPT